MLSLGFLDTDFVIESGEQVESLCSTLEFVSESEKDTGYSPATLTCESAKIIDIRQSSPDKYTQDIQGIISLFDTANVKSV